MFIGFNAAGQNHLSPPKNQAGSWLWLFVRWYGPHFSLVPFIPTGPTWPCTSLPPNRTMIWPFFLGHLAAREKWCWFKPPLPLSKPALFEGDVADAKWGGFKVTAACHRDQKWIKSRMNMDEQGRPAEHMCKNPSECGDFECKACDYNLSPAKRSANIRQLANCTVACDLLHAHTSCGDLPPRYHLPEFWLPLASKNTSKVNDTCSLCHLNWEAMVKLPF